MIYFKRGKWCTRVNGQLIKFDTEEDAKTALGIVEKPLDPLEVLRSKPPTYKTFEDAVDDHGEDEGDFVEEN